MAPMKLKLILKVITEDKIILLGIKIIKMNRLIIKNRLIWNKNRNKLK